MTDSSKPFISIEGLYYTYQSHPGGRAGDSGPEYVLRGINLQIKAGEYLTVVGANGSGKSTLLKHLNALLIPTLGDVWISGWNTRDASYIRNIRSKVGMVFEVPDTQIVAAVVEEDVAFGPENLGIPEDELRQRVNLALEEVGLSELRHRPSQNLSAGQKQLLAIASVLSMKPGCLVLDEATSMLDPAAKLRFLQTIDRLHRKGITVVSATHSMEEAALAQRVIVLSEGRIALEGAPHSIFNQYEILRELKLDVPPPVHLSRRVACMVAGFPGVTLTVDELLNAINRYNRRGKRIYT